MSEENIELFGRAVEAFNQRDMETWWSSPARTSNSLLTWQR
jgi:hypothetical protein